MECAFDNIRQAFPTCPPFRDLFGSLRVTQEHVVDFQIQTHASYAICETADLFRLSDTYKARLIPSFNKYNMSMFLETDEEAMHAAIDNFFRLPNDGNLDSCPSRPLQVTAALKAGRLFVFGVYEASIDTFHTSFTNQANDFYLTNL